MKSQPTPGHQKSAKGSTAATTTEAEQARVAADAIALIKNDHREVELLFQKFESATSKTEKETLVKQICTDLIIHAMLEEELLYPACRDAKVESAMLDEAQVEHDGVKILIGDLMTQPVDSAFYDAKVTVLTEYVKHHVAEEEEPENGILAKAQQAGIDMSVLGERYEARKQQLKQSAETDGLSPPIPRSLHPQPQPQPQRHDASEDKIMDRYSNTPDRDERGRFVSEDQHENERNGRRYRDEDDRRSERGSYQSSSRNHDEDHRRSSGRHEDDDHRQNYRGSGRGWSGDPEGHAEAARKGWDERESHMRSNSRPEEDTRRQYRSRNDDDDRRSGSGSGWYGDPEGHAEAARRGWEEREPSRGRGRSEDDHDHRRGDDRNGDERRSSSRSRDEGHRGWYGDSEGHSEAARRGWDEREASSRSRSRSDDDDDRRRSSSHEGHGGWFGDSRGHSEASRRGWQNRDR